LSKILPEVQGLPQPIEGQREADALLRPDTQVIEAGVMREMMVEARERLLEYMKKRIFKQYPCAFITDNFRSDFYVVICAYIVSGFKKDRRNETQRE
jgi:hypothetical protein